MIVSIAITTLLLACGTALASYTAIVGKDATSDGSVLFFHQEDLGVNSLQHVRVVPRQAHDLEENPMVELYWIEIPQVDSTYAYVGNYTYDDDAIPGGLSGGMNEHGVVIGMNVGYPKEPIPEEDGLLWSDFMQIVLERARTAQEGIEILGWLTEEYHNTDDPGQMYGVADPNEGWIFESTPTRWVAKRVEDDGWWVLANRYTIGTEWDLGSEDIVEFAIDNGWYDPAEDAPFHFARVYTRDTFDRRNEWFPNRPYDYLREARSEQFLTDTARNGGISLEDVMTLMRDHYSDTFLYHDPPHQSPYRNIEISRTVASLVGHLQNNQPAELGSVLWMTLSPPATTPYLPFWAGATEIAEPLGVGVAYEGIEDFDPASAWWSFNAVRRMAEQDWGTYFPVVEDFWSSFERRAIAETRLTQTAALELWNQGDEDGARQLLTDFSSELAQEAHTEAHKLREWLHQLGAEFDH